MICLFCADMETYVHSDTSWPEVLFSLPYGSREDAEEEEEEEGVLRFTCVNKTVTGLVAFCFADVTKMLLSRLNDPWLYPHSTITVHGPRLMNEFSSVFAFLISLRNSDNRKVPGREISDNLQAMDGLIKRQGLRIFFCDVMSSAFKKELIYLSKGAARRMYNKIVASFIAIASLRWMILESDAPFAPVKRRANEPSFDLVRASMREWFGKFQPNALYET